MDKVIATIDVSTPAGFANAPTHKEVFSKLVDKLSEHYKTDLSKKFKLF